MCVLLIALSGRGVKLDVRQGGSQSGGGPMISPNSTKGKLRRSVGWAEPTTMQAVQIYARRKEFWHFETEGIRMHEVTESKRQKIRGRKMTEYDEIRGPTVSIFLPQILLS